MYDTAMGCMPTVQDTQFKCGINNQMDVNQYGAVGEVPMNPTLGATDPLRPVESQIQFGCQATFKLSGCPPGYHDVDNNVTAQCLLPFAGGWVDSHTFAHMDPAQRPNNRSADDAYSEYAVYDRVFRDTVSLANSPYIPGPPSDRAMQSKDSNQNRVNFEHRSVNKRNFRRFVFTTNTIVQSALTLKHSSSPDIEVNMALHKTSPDATNGLPDIPCGRGYCSTAQKTCALGGDNSAGYAPCSAGTL